MRAFVRLRRLLGSHEELARKLAELEKRYDAQFRAVFDAIRQLMAPQPRSGAPSGFAWRRAGRCIGPDECARPGDPLVLPLSSTPDPQSPRRSRTQLINRLTDPLASLGP